MPASAQTAETSTVAYRPRDPIVAQSFQPALSPASTASSRQGVRTAKTCLLIPTRSTFSTQCRLEALRYSRREVRATNLLLPAAVGPSGVEPTDHSKMHIFNPAPRDFS